MKSQMKSLLELFFGFGSVFVEIQSSLGVALKVFLIGVVYFGRFFFFFCHTDLIGFLASQPYHSKKILLTRQRSISSTKITINSQEKIFKKRYQVNMSPCLVMIQLLGLWLNYYVRMLKKNG